MNYDFTKNLLDETILEDEGCAIGTLVWLQESIINAQNYYRGLSKNPQFVLSYTDILYSLSVMDQNLAILERVIEIKKLDIFDDYCLNYEDSDLLICLN